MISRRNVFRKMKWIILALLGYAGYRTSHRTMCTEKATQYRIPGHLAEGLSFYGPVILQKNGSHIRFFSSSCTHLGCRITEENNRKLVCPCHGSEFSADGEILKGPAGKPLMELPFSYHRENDEYIVHLSS